MATLTTTVHSNSIKTAHGGTFTNGDDLYISQWTDDYTADLDQSAKDFHVVNFTPAYGGNITSGVFKFVCDRTSTGEAIFEWSGDRILAGGVGGGTTVWYRLVVNPANGGLVEVFDCNVKNGFVSAGRAIFWDGVDVDNLTVDGGVADVKASGTYTAVDALTVNNGAVDLARNATAVTQNGGRIRATDTSFAPTTLTMNAGLFELLNTGGTIGTLALNGGTLDLRQLSRPLTITTATYKRGSRILMPKNSTLLTITTENLGPGGYNARLAG